MNLSFLQLITDHLGLTIFMGILISAVGYGFWSQRKKRIAFRHILRALCMNGEQYGLDMAKADPRTGGRGVIYVYLTAMEDEGLVASYMERFGSGLHPPRRRYAATAKGCYLFYTERPHHQIALDKSYHELRNMILGHISNSPHRRVPAEEILTSLSKQRLKNEFVAWKLLSEGIIDCAKGADDQWYYRHIKESRA
jgi:DNA-binding PadR family transcriptional regulator